MTTTTATEIERYLRTGDTDPNATAWGGSSFVERRTRAKKDLQDALVAEVRARTCTDEVPAVLRGLDLVAFTRGKVAPMVNGLFPRDEQPTVLAMLERSVVFLTPANIEQVLRDCEFPRSAWDIANLYLGSVGAELLGDEAPRIVGLSEATTCYVSPAYFEEDDPFADFVVHEAAHVFHNCKRRAIGLREIRRREWLLDIQFEKRETFAYSTEVYARIRERGRSASERRTLADEFAAGPGIMADHVVPSEVADIVGEACETRNGWKAILARCAPPPRSRLHPPPNALGRSQLRPPPA